ncbi:MAG: LysM peptidoglycan-binding domain-containing protein [Gammaproteobacteria bacterium]|nr:LysM peptidoglycan-binding domain-containing protein [Gammaproteobacteria bacterium]
MFTKQSNPKVLPLITSIGLVAALSGCQTFSKQTPQDDVSAAESADYYMETTTVDPGRVRVMDPDAVGITPKNTVDRRAEAQQAIKQDHPGSYVVQKGDTLWDISGKFLSKPWLWPEIWDVNPQIENPHLIYPGDEVAMRYVDGKPTIVVSRDGKVVDTGNGTGMSDANPLPANAGGTTRLSPRVREESLANAIPTIPGDAIQQFLVYPRVVDTNTIDGAPYVIGDFEGRLASSTGQQVYVRGDLDVEQTTYGIFRESKELKDPDTRELLGYEVTHVGDANLLHSGDPATMLITNTRMETLAGDRVMSQNQNFVVHNYVPRVPQIEGEGKIISLFNSISQSGRNQVVVLNMGDREGVRVGDVMAIEHRGGRIKDRFSGKPHDFVDIPNTRIGVLMVFRTFDKVSYGLIMESTRPIHLQDAVTGI